MTHTTTIATSPNEYEMAYIMWDAMGPGDRRWYARHGFSAHEETLYGAYVCAVIEDMSLRWYEADTARKLRERDMWVG